MLTADFLSEILAVRHRHLLVLACSDDTGKKHLLIITMNHAGADANSGFRILQAVFTHVGNLSAGAHTQTRNRCIPPRLSLASGALSGPL